MRIREELARVLAGHTGQPLDRVHSDTERDFYMTGEQAKEYGIIDRVIDKRL